MSSDCWHSPPRALQRLQWSQGEPCAGTKLSLCVYRFTQIRSQYGCWDRGKGTCIHSNVCWLKLISNLILTHSYFRLALAQSWRWITAIRQTWGLLGTPTDQCSVGRQGGGGGGEDGGGEGWGPGEGPGDGCGLQPSTKFEAFLLLTVVGRRRYSGSSLIFYQVDSFFVRLS